MPDIVDFGHAAVTVVAMHGNYVLCAGLRHRSYLTLVLILPVSLLVGAILYKMLIPRILGAHHFTPIICTPGVFISSKIQ